MTDDYLETEAEHLTRMVDYLVKREAKREAKEPYNPYPADYYQQVTSRYDEIMRGLARW